MNWKRVSLYVAAVTLAVGAVYGSWEYRAYRQRAELLEGLQVAEVQLGSLVATVGATGTVRADQTALLPWGASGTVEAVSVEVGDQVEAGETLAWLAQKSLPQNIILAESELVSAQNALEDLYEGYSNLAVAQAAQAVADAEKAVEKAQWQLESVESPASQEDIDQAYANLVLAKNRLDETQADVDHIEYRLRVQNFRFFESASLYRKLLRSLRLTLAQDRVNYEDALQKYNRLVAPANPADVAVAQANLALAQEQLAEAQEEYQRLLAGPDPQDVAAAEARVAAAQATLDLAQVEAPFAGTVTQAEPKAGDRVTAGQAAFRLDDLTRLLVDVQVSEVDVNRVALGQAVRLTFDAILGEEYEGRVVEVSPVGSEQQGVVNFRVTVELVGADGAVKPGMTAAVNVVVSELEQVLRVPNRAVRVLEGRRVVYVLGAGGELEAVEVELGASSEEYSQVVGGELRVGDEVVLNPPAVFEQNGPPPFVGR